MVKTYAAGRAAFFEALATARADLRSGKAGALARVGAVDSLGDPEELRRNHEQGLRQWPFDSAQGGGQHACLGGAGRLQGADTGGGPVPTPFVNSAQDSMLAKGSKSVSIDGNPVALTSSELSTSSGDEPGTAGGLISSKFQGKMTWGSGSVDVKVEGKGVVRFLDPTLHNGNTFNTSFIAAGGTGLAYGDDSKCKACGKSPKTHRVLEMPEASAHVERVFVVLMKRLHEQRPLINRYLQLKEERKELDQKLTAESHAAELLLGPKKRRRDELTARLKSPGGTNDVPLKNELTSLQKEVAAAERQNKEKRSQGRVPITVIEQELININTQLEQMKPVLSKDKDTGTFSFGYMLGACICKCPESPMLLVASSGKATPGFREAVSSTPSKLVESFQVSQRQADRLKGMKREKWECAAPKLLQAAGAGGHKARTMSERYFSPVSEHTVEVTHRRSEQKKTRREARHFGHGESVPSCETCQKLIPEMLCDNHKECV